MVKVCRGQEILVFDKIKDGLYGYYATRASRKDGGQQDGEGSFKSYRGLILHPCKIGRPKHNVTHMELLEAANTRAKGH